MVNKAQEFVTVLTQKIIAMFTNRVSRFFLTQQSRRIGTQITKTIYEPPGDETKICFVLDNVFTKEECSEWIEKAENKGFVEALVNVGGGKQLSLPELRNSYRCIIDDHKMADQLWQRIKSFLPAECIFLL